MNATKFAVGSKVWQAEMYENGNLQGRDTEPRATKEEAIADARDMWAEYSSREQSIREVGVAEWLVTESDEDAANGIGGMTNTGNWTLVEPAE
jgi:hypothetical protein